MAINGKGRPTKAQAAEKEKYNSWMDCIAAYERAFKPWEQRSEKILKRYRDERNDSPSSSNISKFNVLWANVQTLIPATFSRVPQPDVSRRFRDSDPVGRVAALLLERSLEFEVKHYPDYKATMKQIVADRFLGGRGTAWARYEPHMRAGEGPVDGDEVTEDIDEPDEELDYECAPVDYVHPKDFGHSVARTWEEVTRVWRNVYMTRDACVTRFGDEVGKSIPLDSTPEEQTLKGQSDKTEQSRALVIEGWDKEKKEAVWLSKSLNKILDTKPDPLRLEGFFPCPKPLYATLTNDSLVPVPDFTLYQDQARELDTLSDRIDGLVKALQVKGTYDASVPELGRLFTEAVNTQLIPVTNWASFVEKNGLAGAISLIDLKPIADALKTAYEAFFQVKAKIDEITGLADIIRGVTDPNETLGAQEMKGEYASLRLKDYQMQVAESATAILQLKAQIICGKFDPETVLQISSASQLSKIDQQAVPQALELLMGPRAKQDGQGQYIDPDAESRTQNNPLRAFRIDIAADTLVQLDEQREKQAAVEFITAMGGFIKQAGEIVQQNPAMVPFVGEMLKFGASRFKVGKTFEGIVDEAVEKANEAAMKPKPPSPEQQQVEAEIKEKMERLQLDGRKQQWEEEKGRAEIAQRGEELKIKGVEATKPEAVEQVNPDRENAEVAETYSKVDVNMATAEKLRAEASVVPQKAAIESMTADVAADKTAAETGAITAPVEEEKSYRNDIGAQLKEIAAAVKGMNEARAQDAEQQAQRAIKGIEKVRDKDGKLIAVRHLHADGSATHMPVSEMVH